MTSWKEFATRMELRRFAKAEARIHRLKVEIMKAQDVKYSIYHKAKYRRRKAAA